MQLTVIGVNHQTAPLSIREKLAFAAAELPDAVGSLIDSDAALEAVILSTCNRTELYCVGESAKITDWLAARQGLTAEEIRPYLYTYGCSDTVRHAFRVASVKLKMPFRRHKNRTPSAPGSTHCFKKPFLSPKKSEVGLRWANIPFPWLPHRSKWPNRFSLRSAN